MLAEKAATCYSLKNANTIYLMKGSYMMKKRRFFAGILSMLLVMSLGVSAFAGGISKESNSAPARRQYGVLPIRDAYASSELIENGLVYKAANAVDGKTSTCWVEGGSGYGIGESITLHLNGRYDVSMLSITGGWAINSELFNLNARPSVLYVYFSSSPNEHYRINMDNTSSTQSFQVNEKNVDWVKFEIREVYQGKKGVYDTCISEITLYGQ